jgi:hypothetical protein
MTTENTPYHRVPGGKSMVSAWFRMGADSFTYVERLTEYKDRLHFKGRGDLQTQRVEDRIRITCRGIQVTVLSEEDIEILRATAAFAFEDHLIESLRRLKIPESFTAQTAEEYRNTRLEEAGKSPVSE